jgi:hypothetical protein
LFFHLSHVRSGSNWDQSVQGGTGDVLSGTLALIVTRAARLT